MAEPKRIKVTREHVDPDSPAGGVIWPIVDELIAEHHSHLATAKIAVVLNKSWRANTDGRVRVAELRKTGPLHRALLPDAGRDFVLEVNEDYATGDIGDDLAFWIDNALCAGQPQLDAEGQQKKDEEGRPMWRLSQPHVVLFLPAYERHGSVTAELASFRNLAMRRFAEDRPILAALGHTPWEDKDDSKFDEMVKNAEPVDVAPSLETIVDETSGADSETVGAGA